MLLERIQATLSGAGLPGGIRHIAVAVSGGADSTATALALHHLWAPLGIRLTLVHIDHTLPEAEAPGDAAFVRRLADRLGAAFANRVVDVRAEMARSGESLEMAARRLRYAALAAAARDAGADALALGHNADDQLETLLLRLARGTGPRGLGGMAPLTCPDGALPIVRPLLDCPRAAIRAWLRAQDVEWLEDPTNDGDEVLRNRVRHHVLPAFYKALGEHARNGTLRSMALLRDEERDWLAHTEREALCAVRTHRGEGAMDSTRGVREVGGEGTMDSSRGVRGVGGEGALSCEAIAALPRPLARRVCLLALQKAGVPAALQTFDAVERLCTLATAPVNGTRQLDLGAGFRAIRVYDSLRIEGSAEPVVAESAHCRSRLTAVAAEGFRRPLRADPRDRPAVASVSRAAIPDPGLLSVRRVRPGDRIRPVGAPGSRKIADILVDRKMPRAERKRVEVVCLGERVAWLPGHAVDAAFAVESATAPSWTLTLEREEDRP